MGNREFKCKAIRKALVLLMTAVMLTTILGCTPKKATLASANLDFDNNPTSNILFAPEGDAVLPAKTEQRALISFAGDTCLSSMQGSSAFNSVYDAEGAEYFLSGVKDIFANDDYTVVNLEAPFTTATARADKGPAEDDKGNPIAFWFKAPLEYVEILKLGSVEACNLANNHILDYGNAGRQETEKTLADAEIDFFIWNTTLVKEVNGIKIGFFGFSFDSDAANIKQIIDQLKAEGAETIVAYFHDGIEGTYQPSSSQKNAAYAAIDNGAAAVIMSHPHVIQGTEEYNGAFIAWSLGNFCYGGHNNPNDKDSMIVQLEFVRSAEGITCTPKLIPCSITSTSGTNDYRPQLLEGTEAQRWQDKVDAM